MITHKKEVKHTFTLELNGDEMLALDAIVGYGTDNFLKVFYQFLGRHYLQPHEKGCRTLFDKVSNCNAPSKVRK
jgi:hypothetical protein